ncbi:ras-related protein Rab-7L1-like [Amia ocellicauda]|uniref:ras-related protein Rab-7L1-like n=1 Tax=Amia ocellicauda TaxID=2972642 RepID=UPI0034642D58
MKFNVDKCKVLHAVDLAVKVLQYSDTETVRLQLWDISGYERSTPMTRLYYREAASCIIKFDVTNPSTFHNCLIWKWDMDNGAMLLDGRPVPCILLANKCDLSPWAMTQDSVEEFSRSHGFNGWLETSAKDNKNIQEAMSVLVKKMMTTQPGLRRENQGGRIQQDSVPQESFEKGCC